MPSSYDVVTSVLSVVYALFGLNFAVSLRHAPCRIPLTSQQQVVLACALFCFTRTIFFIICTYAWDATAGIVGNRRVAFISLDETSHILFLVIISAVILFWAKVFSTAGGAHQLRAFDRCVYPAVVLTGIGALVGVVVTTSVERSNSWNVGMHPLPRSDTTNQNVGEGDMFAMPTSLLLSVAYFLAAAALTYYMRAASRVLEEAPVVVSARLQRLASLRRLGIFLVLVLLCRCVVLLSLSGRALHTVTAGQLTSLVLGYAALELLPLLVIGSVYRIEALPMDPRSLGVNSSGGSAACLYGLDRNSEDDAAFEGGGGGGGGVHSGEVQPLLRARNDGQQEEASQSLGLLDKDDESARILQRLSRFGA